MMNYLVGVIQEVMMMEEELRKSMKDSGLQLTWEDPKFESGLIFESKDVLSDAVKQHGLKRGRKLKVAKSDPTRLTVVYTGNGLQMKVACCESGGDHYLAGENT